MKHFITAVMLLFVTGPASAQNFELEKLFPQVQCMALNVYYEARGSNLADKAAVADVVLNRVNDTRYPDTVCGVVKQGLQDASGNMLRNKCQFSWYCDGRSDYPTDRKSWEKAKRTAMYVLNSGDPLDITEGATLLSCVVCKTILGIIIRIHRNYWSTHLL